MEKISLLLCLCLTIAIPSFSAIHLDEPFDEIRVNGRIDLVLEAGEEDAIDIPFDEDKVSVEVKEGTLVIKRKERWKYSSYKQSVKVAITYKEKLRGLSAYAGAEVSSHNALVTADAFELDFGSGAVAELEIAVDDLEVDVGEGAVLELEGTATELQVRAATGGQVEAFDLKAERVYARANTGGEVEVSAVKAIEATAHTGGFIIYRGDPERVNISDELGGKVKRPKFN